MTRISGLSKALERYINQVRTELSASQYGALRNFVDDFRSADNELQEFKTRIAELEAENEKLKAERRWIPVEERLPKDNEYVLVYCSANGFYNIDCLYDGSWLEAADYYEEDIIVTHWMPLPKPPEVELWNARRKDE